MNTAEWKACGHNHSGRKMQAMFIAPINRCLTSRRSSSMQMFTRVTSALRYLQQSRSSGPKYGSANRAASAYEPITVWAGPKWDQRRPYLTELRDRRPRVCFVNLASAKFSGLTFSHSGSMIGSSHLRYCRKHRVRVSCDVSEPVTLSDR